MAKVTSPLHSAKARGQIQKALVFFPWKSINAVRGYVVPTNPKSAGQLIVRAKFKDLVSSWHSATWTLKDRLAFALSAKFKKDKPQSAFNWFLGLYLGIFKKVSATIYFSDLQMPSTDPLSMGMRVTTSDITSDSGCNCFWGVTPTALINVVAATLATTYWSVTGISTGLPTGTKIYFQFRQENGTPDLIAESGIGMDILVP